MRLTAIKLAGFKSFVDPITFRAPTNLTGIVGPNGCGKSNIIDAVRWVMGEISAKVLRGESMSDVIFSGSSARKPVGSAQVELIFDNSDGQIGGEYAGYNEISVKRVVSRDNQSSYYLNGSRCRRKDIMDIFLGTGLGPRSYSIIEQGMISQIVDSKPEEVRGFLEEAAGISKYKERRRETENRIRHTRENLDRLSDLREEIGKQLSKLKRQATAAERWKAYKSEYRKIEGQVLALGWRDLTARGEAQQKRLAEKRNQLEKLNAEQRRKEAELEQLRNDQHEATEAFNSRQSTVYEVGGEIARVEQGIEHAREIRNKQQVEYEETQANMAELEQHLVLDKTQVEKLTMELGQLEPELRQRSEAESSAREQAQSAREALRSARDQLDAQREQAGDALRRADVLKARIEHHDQQIRSAMARREELRQEQKELKASGIGKDEADQASLQEKAATAAGLESESLKLLDEKRTELQGIREQINQVRDALNRSRSERSRLEGEAQSLQNLQQAAVDAGEAERGWYEARGLDQAQVLASSLKVDKGWERIVEAILGDALTARLAGDVREYVDQLDAAEGADVWLVGDSREDGKAGTMGGKVKGPTAVIQVLNRIRVAEDLSAASKLQSQLNPGESVITPAGEWLGDNWVRRIGSAASEDSMLARAERLQEIEQKLRASSGRLAELQERLQTSEESRQRLEIDVEAAQQAYREAANRHATARSELASSQRRSEELLDRANRVNQQLQQTAEQIQTSESEQREDRQTLDELSEKLAGFEAQRSRLEQARHEADNAYHEADTALQSIRDQRMELALKVEGGRASLDSLRQSIGRMDNQLGQLQRRYMQLSEQLNRDEAPEAPLQEQLEKLLERKVAAEQALTETRAGLQGLESVYREKDQTRLKAAQAADELRSELEQQRLSQREVELKAQALAERVEELGEDLAVLVEALPEEADRGEWDAELEKLAQRIQRLEPVNLAAIQEYDQEAERKEYLDAQHEDLQRALQTLEEAIARIDRKTRTQFKETFEQVNKGVQALFPRLFGGGHAYLELTGDDLLTTGVAIMARPPGKRVSSIHLLSGGEKALTAVALVFAIFQLNPAPFCLLDEVDAPLDDANVARFSDMVREMSEQVQFVFVTHNKITMEMANQLCGVTMREPGVSRLVSVDIDEATEMAQTA